MDGQSIVHEAYPCEKVIQAFYIAHLVPTESCLMQVEEAAGFALSTDKEPNKVIEIQQETDLEITVKAKRLANGKGPITLAAESPDRNIRIKGATLAPNKDEATVTISISNRVEPKHYSIIITGTMKAGKETIERIAPALLLEAHDWPAFEAALSDAVAAARNDPRAILGVADRVPVQAEVDRLQAIAEWAAEA